MPPEGPHVHGNEALTGAYVGAIESWMVLTIVAGLPMLWAMSLILQLGRPYVVRTLHKLGLRFGADVWWLSYVLARDFVMIATFALSFIFLVPDLAKNEPMPLTGALSTLFLFWALLVRLTRDADDNPRDFALVSILASVGAALFFVPMVFGVKASIADENAAHVKFLVTSTNWEWAKWIIVASIAGFVATAGYIFSFFMSRSLRQLAAMTPERRASTARPSAREAARAAAGGDGHREAAA